MRVVLVGLVLCTTAAAGPRPGKVVRIERAPRPVATAPRLCKVTSDTMAMCIGKRPAVGERLTALDQSRVLGQLRVVRSEDSPYNGCLGSALWEVEVQAEGSLSLPAGEGNAVIDVSLDPRNARQVSVDHSPVASDAETVVAIDSNGDGTADVEFAQYPCDDQGAPSGVPTGACFDVWVRSAHGYDRVRQDKVKNCP